MSLLQELKTRGVLRVVVAYLAVAWLALQLAEILLPAYGFGDAAIRNLVTALVAGLLVAVGFSWFFQWTPTGIAKESALKASEQEAGVPEPRTHRRLDRFTVLVLAVAVAFFVVDKFILDPARDQAREQAVAEQARTEALKGSFGDHSIAVLPFRDLSPQGDQAYFSEGVAEEVLNLLTRIPGLRVAGRASAFTFKDRQTPIPVIGERLNVAYVLDGSVSRAGASVRVTAQLVNAQTDTQLWSDKYDRQLDDLFGVQDEIAARVVGELRLRILSESRSEPTLSAAAFEQFLKARFILHDFTSDRRQEADELLRGVLVEEPGYTPALALLWDLRSRQWSQTRSDILERELHGIAEQMVASDPNSPDTLRIQAVMAVNFGNDPATAIDRIERALRADPGNIDVLRISVYFLLELQQFDDAITVAKQLLLREPSCGRCLNALANAYRGSGRYREGAEYLVNIPQWGTAPNGYFWNLGVLWLGAGEPARAMAAWEQEAFDVGELWWLLALHDLGVHEEFSARFEAFRADPAQHPESIARIYAHLGDADNAFAWLERMFDPASNVDLVYFDTDIYAPIKSDPRWEALVQKHFGDTVLLKKEFRMELPPELGNF